ncbi:MAG: TIGR01212 family radical SAM protein [candidate division FCPU426 bacterium]
MPEARSRWRAFSAYLRERFGGPVRKLPVHAGFTCPNRDGSLSSQGCIFCEPSAFAGGTGVQRQGPEAPPMAEQLRQGVEQGKRQGILRFMAYFQSYTNTYAPPAVLRGVYGTIRAFPEIKSLAIGTRPDCVDEAVLAAIAEFLPEYEVWMEYGLQSSHDASLAWLNRGHDSAAFKRAVELTRQWPQMKICAHVILGIPGETGESEAETALAISRWRLEGVKLHPLYAVAGTALAGLFHSRRFEPLGREAYVERVVSFLERLRPEVVIQRLTADCPADKLVAPQWLLDKSGVLADIQAKMEAEDTWQGKRLEG